MDQGKLVAIAAILHGISSKLDVMDSRLDVMEFRLEAVEKGSPKEKKEGETAERLVRERDCVEEMVLIQSGERKRQLAQLESLCEEGSYFAYVDSFMSIANQVDLSEETRVTMFVKGLKEGSTKLIQVLNPKTLQQAIAWGRALTADKDPYESKGRNGDMRVSSTYLVAWTNIKQEGSITGGKTCQGARMELIPRGTSMETTNGTITYLPPHRRLNKTSVDVKQDRRLCSRGEGKFNLGHNCDQQSKEVNEVNDLPLKQPEFCENLKIAQTKNVLLYGLSGIRKTLLAKVVVHHTDDTFIRELFAMARKLVPSIIFMEEIDGMGFVRRKFRSSNGDSGVQRTILEFQNRHEGLEALLSPGQIVVKFEFLNPNKEFQLDTLKFHSGRMNYEKRNWMDNARQGI